MGRSPCCSKEGLNRGAWTAHEDKILREYIRLHGEGRWRNLPKRAGLKRCGKSCRLRWLNYLRPDIKRGNISPDEEDLIIRLHKLLGNRWSLIAGRLPGRTDNEIKNYWNTNLGKKVVKDDGHQEAAAAAANPMLLSPNTKLLDSHVVRTKATKCTKQVLFLNPSIMQTETETEAILPAVEHSTTYDNGFLSSSDLQLIDFNQLGLGDICLSDLLNSDFSNAYNFTTCTHIVDHDHDQLSPSSADEPLNASNNLHSFIQFLDSTQEEFNH